MRLWITFRFSGLVVLSLMCLPQPQTNLVFVLLSGPLLTHLFRVVVACTSLSVPALVISILRLSETFSVDLLPLL
jgi:hypothetical protein